jgi:hypothetical protein
MRGRGVKAEALAATREHRRKLQTALKTGKPGLRHPIKLPLRSVARTEA